MHAAHRSHYTISLISPDLWLPDGLETAATVQDHESLIKCDRLVDLESCETVHRFASQTDERAHVVTVVKATCVCSSQP